MPMIHSRRMTYTLLGGLFISSLVLLLIAVLDPRQRFGLPLGLGIWLLLVGLALFVLYYFSSWRAAASDREELEQRFGFLVRHVKDYAIFLIDPEGRVMSWNKGAERIKGYSEAEIIGQPISIFYTDEDNRRGEPYLNLRRALEEGRYESIGVRKRKDGSVFYADVVFTPIYDDKNVLKGFAKITRDISDQKKAEQDMQETLRREKELSELKSRFVTLASHEFKTPLSVILSSVSLIEKYPETEQQDKRLKHVHRIKSNVNNLKQILNDFLSLEKLEDGIIKNCPVETDLVQQVGETIHDMEEAVTKGQEVRLQTIGNPRPVWVDAQLLRNILNNLLSNAIKYSPAGGSIDVTLSYRPAGVDIEVKDEGIGIPAEERQHLFERFFRASNTTGISGTGLGLSIVRRYLDLMGGDIQLTSQPGQGSTFKVMLPAGEGSGGDERS
jgi:two-component system, LuxR family, sensor kinase FixL